MNTQVVQYNNNIPKQQQQMKPYYPQQVTLGQQFSKPTVQVRPNYHFIPNNYGDNMNLIQQQKYQYQQTPISPQSPSIINHQLQQKVI